MTRIERARRRVTVARYAIGITAAAALAGFAAVARATHPGTAQRVDQRQDDRHDDVELRRLELAFFGDDSGLVLQHRPVRQRAAAGPVGSVVNAFRAMGCEVVLPYGVPVGLVRALFEERDARFSRFRPSSELSRVNALPLGLTLVSEEFASMLSLSLDAARATDGLVTPAVGGAIVAAGYDRDFADSLRTLARSYPAAVPSWQSISLHGGGLLRTETVQLDLNGVVKGKTVDDALELVGRGWVVGRRRRRRARAGRRRPSRRRHASRSTAAGSPRRASRSGAGSRTAFRRTI